MKTEHDYRQLAAQLRRYAEIHEKSMSGRAIEDEENLERDAADVIEELLESRNHPEIVRVETPLGALIARDSCGDPDYPGIYIALRRPNADHDMILALVEFTAIEGDLPNGEGHIITRVYGDDGDEYTDRVVHKGIEEFFRTEEVPENEVE